MPFFGKFVFFFLFISRFVMCLHELRGSLLSLWEEEVIDPKYLLNAGKYSDEFSVCQAKPFNSIITNIIAYAYLIISLSFCMLSKIDEWSLSEPN